jgi:hypothetical protein
MAPEVTGDVIRTSEKGSASFQLVVNGILPLTIHGDRAPDRWRETRSSSPAGCRRVRAGSSRSHFSLRATSSVDSGGVSRQGGIGDESAERACRTRKLPTKNFSASRSSTGNPTLPHMRFPLLSRLLPLLAASALTASAFADDWGAYTIAPVNAKAAVLEVVGSGTTDGTLVSIGKPAGTANQKWMITPKGDNFYTIHPLSSPALALAAKGSAANGTPIVIETDNGSPEQWWTLNKNESGSFSLSPKFAPKMGIDDNGGKQDPGSKIDLWIHNPNDQHLQWTIKPLAGSGLATAAASAEDLGPGGKPYAAPEIKPEDIKEGRIETFTFTESKVFPGTTRGVTVFIPAQYDGSKPACVYVKTDGYNPR